MNQDKWFGALSLVVVAVVCTACSEVGEPYLGALPATSTTVLLGVAPEPANNGLETVENPIVQALPPRPSGYVPDLIISTASGPAVFGASDLEVYLLNATSAEDPEFPSSPGAVLAVDDLLRGFVMQQDDGSVRWFPAETDSGQLINTLGGRLFDVGYTDATPEAIVQVSDRIDRVRLVDGDRFLLTQLSLDEELLDLSTTGGLSVLVLGNTDCGELRFLNRLGEPLELGGPSGPECPVARRPAFGTAALSPDGEAVAYTTITYRPDGVERGTTLVAQELGSGDRLFEDLEVGSSGEVVESLAFDGERAALIRRTSQGSEVLLVEDGAISVIKLEGLGNPRSVTFARLPVTKRVG